MWNFWLRAFTRFVLAALVNSLLALTCVFFFVERNDSAGERWFVFLLALGVLTIAPIVFALKRFLTDVLLGWATMRHAQKTMLVELRRAHMPTDDEYPISTLEIIFVQLSRARTVRRSNAWLPHNSGQKKMQSGFTPLA